MPCTREDVIANCETVPCPCPGPCDGTLRSDGRNVQDDLTFLQCDRCGCTYVAEDKSPPSPGAPGRPVTPPGEDRVSAATLAAAAVIELAVWVAQRQHDGRPATPNEARSCMRDIAARAGLNASETMRLKLVAAALTEPLPDVVL